MPDDYTYEMLNVSGLSFTFVILQVSGIQDNVRRRRRNLKRKHQRLQKQPNVMRLMRSPTPGICDFYTLQIHHRISSRSSLVPEVVSSAEEKALRVGGMLTDKDCSILVDLSNYKPFTAANDACFMVS